MCKVGDKFIIEIGGEYAENPFENGENGKAPTILYKIKGFNSLVFDEKGLDRLEKAENLERLAYDRGYSKAENDYFKQTEVDAENTMQAGYEKGLYDAWEYAKKFYSYNFDQIKEIFGENRLNKINDDYTAQEIIEKIKAFEQKQEIKVGDVVVVYPNNYKACVIAVADTGQLTVYDKQRNTFKVHKDNVRKTGKHIDLTDIFKGLEGEDGD